MRISDWSSDVCSSDLKLRERLQFGQIIIEGVDRGVEAAIGRNLQPRFIGFDLFGPERQCFHRAADRRSVETARLVARSLGGFDLDHAVCICSETGSESVGLYGSFTVVCAS